MKELINKFVKLEKDISKEKGNFNLFALVYREDLVDKWDLVISSDWVISDKIKALNYLVDKIKVTIGEDVLLNLARIVLLDPTEKFVINMNASIATEHNSIDLDGFTLNNIYIKKAFIITSKKAKEVQEALNT